MTIKTALARVGAAVRAHPWRTLALFPVAILAYVLVLIPFTPSIGDIKKAKMEHPTVVMSVDGKELATFKRANRDWVKLSDISPHVVDALIATEDKRFFSHHGMDFKRTFSALLATLGGDRQGGSTITQQLARNLYPDDVGRAPTITRKIKEAITALKIESIYTKQEILETYLNTVPFLYNAYGVDMAARTYFDKPADKLDVVESATLVGMLKGTSYYNPVLNPERSLERRNTVLALMADQGKLDGGNFESLKKRPLGLDFEKLPELAGPAPHLARQLRQWLGEWADRNGYNIYTDGLIVRTSIDSRLQDYANDAVKKQMDKLQPLADARRNAVRGNRAVVEAFIRDTPEYHALREQGTAEGDAIKQLQANASFMKSMWEDKTRLETGFLAMEPGTGYIRAWVGSRDFQQDQFDHVNQARRQPGSTFKPFVYGAAFEQGISPWQQFPDTPVQIQIDRNKYWTPKDVDPPSGQMMTLRDALAQSKNTITAQLMQQVGPDRVASLARAMGIRQSKLDVVPSLALGTSPVTLKELVASYATIANNGDYVEPQLVLRIEDRQHHVLEEFQPATAQPALTMDADQTLLDVMRAVVDSGTGVRIRSAYGITGDVAGKTGTTQNDTDGWFVLMHPQLVAGSWVGFNDARVTMIHEWGQGAHSALPIVGDVVSRAIKAKVIDGKSQFAAPKNKGAPVTDPSLMGRVGDWINGVFGGSSQPPEQMPEVVVTQPTEPLPQLPPAPSYEPAPRQPDASIAMPSSPDTTSPAGNGNSNASSPSILSLGLPPAAQGPRNSAVANTLPATPPQAAAPVETPKPAPQVAQSAPTAAAAQSTPAPESKSSRQRVVTLPSGSRAIIVQPPSNGSKSVTITLGGNAGPRTPAPVDSSGGSSAPSSPAPTPRVEREPAPAQATGSAGESSASDSPVPTEASGSAGTSSPP